MWRRWRWRCCLRFWARWWWRRRVVLRLGSIRSILLFSIRSSSSSSGIRTWSCTTLRRRLSDCPSSDSHDCHQHHNSCSVSCQYRGHPGFQNRHDDDVDSHCSHCHKHSCYEAVSVWLQRGQVDEATACRVGWDDEDVIVSIRQTAAGRSRIVAVRRRRRRWTLVLHFVRLLGCVANVVDGDQALS